MSAAQVRPCRDCAVRSNKHCFECGRAAQDVQVPLAVVPADIALQAQSADSGTLLGCSLYSLK